MTANELSLLKLLFGICLFFAIAAKHHPANTARIICAFTRLRGGIYRFDD